MKRNLFYTLFALILTLKSISQNIDNHKVKTFPIEATQLDTTKTIWVYLPKSYKTSGKDYPVFYMHDAQNLFDEKTSYAGEWKVDEFLNTVNENEIIVIGIEHGNEKRLEELTPFPNTKYGGGKGDLYLDFIVNTLKPHIDSTYNVKTDVKNTTIFGSSLGGLISLYAILKYPNTFGNVGVFSPSFWINENIYEFAYNSTISKKAKFYFLVGGKEGLDMVEGQKRMVNLLRSKGVKKKRIVSEIIEFGEHNETLWSTFFPEAYKWLID